MTTRVYELRDNIIRDIERGKPRVGDVIELCDAFNAIVAAKNNALAQMIYEATAISPCEDDGSHRCRISAAALANARAARTLEWPQ